MSLFGRPDYVRTGQVGLRHYRAGQTMSRRDRLDYVTIEQAKLSKSGRDRLDYVKKEQLRLCQDGTGWITSR